MHMTLDNAALQLGSITIYWYGICVASAFVVGLSITHWGARRRGLPPDRVTDLGIPAILGGIAGARIFYVLSHWQEFHDHLIDIIKIHRGGLVFYGGLMGATAAVAAAIRLKRLPAGKVADSMALALPVGEAIGRIGCLINGCCFGKPTSCPLEIIYQPDSAVMWTQVRQGLLSPMAAEPLPVWPAPMSQAALNLGVFGLLLWLQNRLHPPGRLFASYLMLYAIARFGNEFLRGDYLTFYAGLTIGQVVSVVMLAAGAGLYWWLGRRTPRPESP